MKITTNFLKSLKENKNKIGILKVINAKITSFDKVFFLSKQKISDFNGWELKKIDATSIFGAYRIILAKNSITKKIVYDFYFKNHKNDLTKLEISDLKDFVMECNDDEFYNNLQDFSLLGD